MTSGQGAAAAKALVALAAQLPAEAIDALNREQAAAIANVRRVVGKYGLGLSEFSVYVSLQPDEAGRAVNSLAGDEPLTNAAATLYSFCTEWGPPLESTFLNASSLQTLPASGARDPSHKQRKGARPRQNSKETVGHCCCIEVGHQ